MRRLVEGTMPSGWLGSRRRDRERRTGEGSEPNTPLAAPQTVEASEATFFSALTGSPTSTVCATLLRVGLAHAKGVRSEVANAHPPGAPYSVLGRPAGNLGGPR